MTPTSITSRNDEQWNDFIDWKRVNTSTKTQFETDQKRAFEILHLSDGMQSYGIDFQAPMNSGAGFHGCFNDGDALIVGVRPSIPLRIRFLDGAKCKAVGAQIQPGARFSSANSVKTYFGHLTIFDAPAVPVNDGVGANVTQILQHRQTDGGANDLPKATFLGVRHDDGLSVVEFYAESRVDLSLPKAEAFYCNTLSLKF